MVGLSPSCESRGLSGGGQLCVKGVQSLTLTTCSPAAVQQGASPLKIDWIMSLLLSLTSDLSDEILVSVTGFKSGSGKMGTRKSEECLGSTFK